MPFYRLVVSTLLNAMVCFVIVQKSRDMKRYHTLLAGASWMAEYGNPDTDDWQFLQKYSPYHNIDKNADYYPALLVTTSTRDDRVHPGHARKFVKKLWDSSTSSGQGKNWPIFYYENIEGPYFLLLREGLWPRKVLSNEFGICPRFVAFVMNRWPRWRGRCKTASVHDSTGV